MIVALYLGFVADRTVDTASVQWLSSQVDKLPHVTELNSDPSAYVSLANRLIVLGPAKTWEMIDNYLSTQEPTFMDRRQHLFPPERGWQRLLGVLPLLFEWHVKSDIGNLTDYCLPNDFPASNSVSKVVYVFPFYIRYATTPKDIEDSLRTIDWRLFRRAEIQVTGNPDLAFIASQAKAWSSRPSWATEFINKQTKLVSASQEIHLGP